MPALFQVVTSFDTHRVFAINVLQRFRVMDVLQGKNVKQFCALNFKEFSEEKPQRHSLTVNINDRACTYYILYDYTCKYYIDIYKKLEFSVSVDMSLI